MQGRISLTAVLCAAACASSHPQPSREAAAPAVSVPDDGSRLIFSGMGEGSQIYICAPKPGGNGPEWKLKAPDATVTDGAGAKLRHSAGPTWEAGDGSKVVGEVKARAEVDAAAIPWLLLQVVGADLGPTGGHRLTETTYIQRVYTSGGKEPTTGCAQAPDVGQQALVPYTADYVFYKVTGRE